MLEDWNSLVKDLVVGVCVIFIIASALAGLQVTESIRTIRQ